MTYSGNKDIAAAGTAETLASSRTTCAWILVQAKSKNTGMIYVGGDNVSSSNGVQLAAFDSVMLPPIADVEAYDLALTYVDSEVNGEGVTFTYFKR